jgi:hypothetical protein
MSDDKIARYELFLDESGTHQEGDPTAAGQRFASQIAGILSPAGELDEASARALLDAIGAPISSHGTALRPGPDFDRTIAALAEQIGRRRWQPVRITNRERAVFGDRVSNYTNVLAELVVRILDRLSTKAQPEVHLAITSARVLIREDERGVLHCLEKAEYRRRIDELVTRAALRRGHAAASRHWQIALRIDSARQRPELMLADLISNASHADFGKLGPAAQAALRAALAPFDFSLAYREDVEAVGRMLDEEAHGLAIVRAADRLADPALDPKVGDRLRGLLHRAADELARLGAPARDPQLQIVASWLGQEVAHGRDHRSSLATCRRLAKDLAARLGAAARDPAEVGWFEYLVHRSALTACNHLGDIHGAREALHAMRRFEPGIAGRWEHLALFVDAQHHEAVHRTDIQEFRPAAEIAARTADFFAEIGGLFQAAMPQHFPERVRARQRGEALGTAMQAAMYEGLDDPARFAQARAWNDAAIDEFGPGPDRDRQLQYRCQLETLAGELDAAWRALAQAVHRDETAAPDAIATAIGDLPPDSIGRQFLLLHAYRLGAAAARTEHPSAAPFVAAFEARFGEDPICRGALARHPAHAVLRYRTEVLLAAGAPERAGSCLSALQRISLPVGSGSPLLASHLAVAQARLARHSLPTEPARTALLLDCPRQPKGLRQILAELARAVDGFAELHASLSAWTAAVDALRNEPGDVDAWARIDGLARRVAH